MFEPLIILVDAGRNKKRITEVDRKIIIRYYLTREILMNLKLVDPNPPRDEENKPLYKPYNPKGNPYFKKIKVKNKNYYKWAACPAGDGELYKFFHGDNEVEMSIMRILQSDYCCAAVQDGPEKLGNLFGIYYNLLREEFAFDDSYDANIFQRKNKNMYDDWMKWVNKYIRRYVRNIASGTGTDKIKEYYQEVQEEKKQISQRKNGRQG